MPVIGPLLFASNNPGKFVEASAICKPASVQLVSPQQLAAGEVPGIPVLNGAAPEVEEIAESYAGNARIKADAFQAWSRLAALADDTGLEVRALGGRPGIHSARYAGPSANGRSNIEKLLSELDQLEASGAETFSRRARFVCLLVLACGKGRYLQAEASLEGEIGREPRGGGGFGYDSVFIVQGRGLTLAQLKEACEPVKTHRILALEKMIAMLKQAPAIESPLC